MFAWFDFSLLDSVWFKILYLASKDDGWGCVKNYKSNVISFLIILNYLPEKEIKQIGIFNTSEFNEELMNVHEKKLNLKFMYEESPDLFEKASRWIKFWTEFVMSEEKTKDPMRFKTRGYSMLEEEKQRKRFNKPFPKLKEDLNWLEPEHQDWAQREKDHAWQHQEEREPITSLTLRRKRKQ